MPIGKPRSAKRSSSSSSSSYVSTISMVVFIALCVVGVWMLTSSSVVPTQQTIRSSNSFSSNTNSRLSSTKFPSRKDPPPAFDDSQGDLPDDAIKGDNNEDSKSKHEAEAENVNLESSEKSDGGSSNEEEPAANEEQKQQQLETQVTEESSNNENQQSSTDSETTSTQQAKEEDSSNANLDQTQHEQQVSENENPIQAQQDSETETNENPNQNRQEESHESSNQNNQHDPEVEPHEITQQIQQETGENPQSTTSEEDQQQQQQAQQETTNNIETHEENTQPEIREVTTTTTEETQQEHGSQDSETQTQTSSSSSEEDHQQQNQNQEVTPENSNDDNKQQQEDGSQQTQQASEDQNQQTSEENTNTNTNTQAENNQESPKSENQETQNAANSGGESFPGGDQSGIPKESTESKGAWSTQAAQSVNQKERRKDGSNGGGKDGSMYGYTWQLCNVTAGQDYIPCLDNEKAVKLLHYTGHFEHRERHCPEPAPTCLVPLPQGYKQTVEWPTSRDKIWYHNVPHTKLAEVKGHQNWVKVTGEFLTFPGGGTQFIHGALHYIDFIQKAVPNIAWGKHTRVILDVGCGVASFGGYLFERDVLAMSFAPKDEHEAQVQFALERGIPAISAVMGSQRLPFPSRVFDLVHCARCRVPWHVEGGRLLLELNRVLRPGGFFVWSATPVYQKLAEDVEIWKAMSSLTASMCWELVTIQKDKLNSVGAAIYRKPLSNDCYEQRKHNSPPMCKNDDDPNAAWYVPLQSCIHRVPVDEKERGTQWPEEWPARVHKAPYWLDSSQKGVYGKSAPDDFASDYEHWKRVVTKSYMTGLGISWSNVRNVMDMRAVYGGFAAALKDLKVWVMNVVSIDAPDTLPIIYERGLFGIYHDWCESFSTYPRTYDLLHADQLFSKLKKRCNILPVVAEVDRIVRPGGKLIVRDESSVVSEIENMLKSLHWEIHLTFSKDQEAILSAQKSDWRPDSYSASS